MLRTKHHVADCLQIFFVLVKFLFKCHCCVDFLLQIHFGLVDLLLGSLELLRIISTDCFKLLIKSCDLLVNVCNFSNVTLQLFHLLFHLLQTFPILVNSQAYLSCPFTTLLIKLSIVFSKLSEGLAGSRFDLESLHLLDYITFIHSLDDRIYIPNEFFFEDFCLLR